MNVSMQASDKRREQEHSKTHVSMDTVCSLSTKFHQIQIRIRLQIIIRYLLIIVRIKPRTQQYRVLYFLMGLRKSKGSAVGWGAPVLLALGGGRGAPPAGGLVWMYPYPAAGAGCEAKEFVAKSDEAKGELARAG